jgi:hypothetical protein
MQVPTYGVARSANATETDPAAALIRRAQVALGPGLGHLKSLHLAGSCNAGDISGISQSWIDLATGRFASNINAGPLTAGYGFDGRTLWRSDSKGIVLPQTGPLARAIGANEIFDGTNALFSPEFGGASVSYLGTRTDSEKSYEVISVKPKAGYAEELWFDATTALLARKIVNYGAETVATNMVGYRSVDGLMIPGEERITHRLDVRDFYGHEQGFVSSDRACKYTEAEANVQDAEKHFGMPPFAVSDVSLPGGETRIPFTMRNFWILLNVRLNGKGPFQLMLDSGGRNILSPSVASQVGAVEMGKIPQLGNLSVKPLRYLRVGSVALGGATLNQQDFSVGNIGNVFTRDGMIGFELFERFVTTIDYAHREIILRLPGHSPDATMASPAAEISVPLLFDDTKPETACKIAGADATCIADTGASLALVLSGPFVKANTSIQPPWFAGAYTRVVGSSGASEVRYGPLSSFQIGSFALANVDTFFTTAANGALAQYLSALVGNRIWQQFTVTFDYSSAVLRLTPNATFVNH